MGIEKLLPRFSDLDVFLKLLPRSGTGQALSTYQSFITGTKRNQGDEGPEELHIIVLDNGRSRMLAHPVTRQSLACIRCGACLNACPVYQQIGGHAYGSVYPGPIGAVITPQLIGMQKAAQLPYASSLCGACREVCPVKIDIPRLLLYLRGEISEKQTCGRARERLAFKLWAAIMTRPRLYERTAIAARLFQRWFKPPLKAWTNGRDLRPIEAESFREHWRRTR
jgi:L-lactate dehydrogenase complex protein LldF